MFVLLLLGYIIVQIHTIGQISGNGKGIQKLDTFLTKNEGNLLDSMNQTVFTNQLNNDIQQVYGFGADQLGLWDFRLNVIPGRCMNTPLVVPNIIFKNT
jgi:hypothetical protein